MANVTYLNSEVRVTVNSQEAVNAIQNIYNSCEQLRKKLKDLEKAIGKEWTARFVSQI